MNSMTEKQENKKVQLENALFDIDKQIVDLLNQRADLCCDLNRLKEENNELIYDPVEELEIQEKLEPLSNYAHMIVTIYPVIQKYGRSLQ